jgi:hypothetical protein
MRAKRGALAVLLAAGIAVSSCGGEGGRTSGEGPRPSSFSTPFSNTEVYPTFVSSEIAVGPNRFLVGLLNEQDAPAGSPDVNMRIRFFDLERSEEEPVLQEDMRWVWIVRPYVGLYAGSVSFDRPGEWGAEVIVRGDRIEETVRASFEVRAEPSTPAVGERVPASATPTAQDARAIARISTDTHPNPRFYESSIAEAMAAREPFVVAFATPKFCRSATCGPMLDNVKKAARSWARVTFIHVEPYELPADPANLEAVPSALEWGLPSEPWVFVVDASGRLRAKFEGAMTPAELDAALRRLP